MQSHEVTTNFFTVFIHTFFFWPERRVLLTLTIKCFGWEGDKVYTHSMPNIALIIYYEILNLSSFMAVSGEITSHNLWFPLTHLGRVWFVCTYTLAAWQYTVSKCKWWIWVGKGDELLYNDTRTCRHWQRKLGPSDVFEKMYKIIKHKWIAVVFQIICVKIHARHSENLSFQVWKIFKMLMRNNDNLSREYVTIIHTQRDLSHLHVYNLFHFTHDI